jgi:hypothetical protein
MVLLWHSIKEIVETQKETGGQLEQDPTPFLPILDPYSWHVQNRGDVKRSGQ